MQTDAIILAAGKGTRMGSQDLPKVLFPVKNKPMINHLMEEVGKLQDIRPIIVVGFKYNLVQNALGPEFKYVFQEGQLGTGHAVASAKNDVQTQNVVVLYGDTPFIKHTSLQKLIAQHVNDKNKLTMFTTKVPNFENLYSSFNGFGRIIRNNSGEINEIVEFADATPEQRTITEVNSGIYIFNSAWLWQSLDKVKNNNMQGEYYLTDVIQLAAVQNEPLGSLVIEPEEVFGINTIAQLEQAQSIG